MRTFKELKLEMLHDAGIKLGEPAFVGMMDIPEDKIFYCLERGRTFLLHKKMMELCSGKTVEEIDFAKIKREVLDGITRKEEVIACVGIWMAETTEIEEAVKNWEKGLEELRESDRKTQTATNDAVKVFLEEIF